MNQLRTPITTGVMGANIANMTVGSPPCQLHAESLIPQSDPTPMTVDEVPRSPRDEGSDPEPGEGPWWLRIVLLVTGLILSVGSAESVKESKKKKPEATRRPREDVSTRRAITIYHGECSTERPASLGEKAKKLVNRCRGKGGTAEVSYLMNSSTNDGVQCNEGSFHFGVKVTCSTGSHDWSKDDGIASTRHRPLTRGNMQQDIIAAHNKWRSSLNLRDLVWSDGLASRAQAWARHLAARGGAIYHSSGHREGENISSCTIGGRTFTEMVDGWASEKKYFTYGAFPHVSTTGNWSDVGHYTQIIWHSTRRVGCGHAQGGGFDILVCRYSPPGNIDGQKPY